MKPYARWSTYTPPGGRRPQMKVQKMMPNSYSSKLGTRNQPDRASQRPGTASTLTALTQLNSATYCPESIGQTQPDTRHIDNLTPHSCTATKPSEARPNAGAGRAEPSYTTTADSRCFWSHATWGLSDPSALGSTLLQDEPHHGPAAHQVHPIHDGCASM